MTPDGSSGDIPRRSPGRVRRTAPADPGDRLLEEEIEAIAEEHRQRRGRPVPRARFDVAVRGKADQIHDTYLDLCRRIREQNGDELDGNDREHAAALRQKARFALWHATRELPELEPNGHPRVDNAGHLHAPEPILLLHFSRDGTRRDRARGTPLPAFSLEGETLDASLGVLEAKKVLRIGRFKNGYKLNAQSGEQLVAKLVANGWNDRGCTETMALEILSGAVDNDELIPLAVVFRLVRAKLTDGRRNDAAAGAGAGGCLLTLETLVVCQVPDGRLLLARILDEPVRDAADSKAAPAQQLKEVARLAWRVLRLVEDHIPSIKRLAVFDNTLALGPSSRRVEVSRIREPGADEHRATEAVAPSELLVNVNTDGAEARRGTDAEVLAGWTVVTRADADLSIKQARHIEAAGVALEPARSLVVYPSEGDFASLDPSRLLDQEQWVISVPHDSSVSIGEEIEFVREGLRDERTAYAKRSAGHRVMFPGTNAPGKVDAVTQVLLAYALAEDLELLADDLAPSPS